MGGFHRLAEKIGWGKSDEAGGADAKSDQYGNQGVGSSDLHHGQDGKLSKDTKDTGGIKGDKQGETPYKAPLTPPPDYEPDQHRQQQEQQQLHPQQQQQHQRQDWLPPSPQQAEHAVPRQFPSRFSLYSTGFSFSPTYLIGTDDGSAIYAVALHSALSSSPPIVLHNGTDPDRSDVMATVEWAGFGSGFSLTLPPMPGEPGAASGVEVEANQSLTNSCYRFGVEVGQPGTNVRAELFEWRRSYGAAVDSLNGSWGGWKLVRMSRGPPPGASGGSPPGEFATSDGFEVVAVWAGSGALSFTETARFSFVGTGVSGLLGERWAVAAVMSALGLWEKERQARRRRRRH